MTFQGDSSHSVRCGSMSSSGCDETTGCDETKTSSLEASHTTLKQGEEGVIGKAENNAVFRIRLMVIAVLVASTVGVACLVYFKTSNAEEDQFEAESLQDAAKVFEALGSTLELSLGAVDAVIVSIVSFARYSNMTWPFVTVPDFATRMAKVRSLSNAVVLAQFAIVSEEERSDWEKYSTANAAWVDEALAIQKEDDTFFGKIVQEYYTSGEIWGNSGPILNNTGPYFPTWEAYPAVPIYAPFNWDGSQYSSLVDAFETLEQDHQVVIGQVNNLPNPDDPASSESIANQNAWVKNYVSSEFDHTEPYSEIYYPIFDNAADQVSIAKHENGMKMVSVFSMTFYWRDLIENILPPGSIGSVVVFKNTCNQTFTYQINGPQAEYVGVGDLHDPKYDYLKQESRLNDLKEFATGNRQYTGLPLSETSCPYTVTIYPSLDFENRYTSTDPAVYTIMALSIFFFTSLIFLLYDVIVERRQKKVMTTALKSGAIVSSLFPSNVRSRLYENEPGTAERAQKNRLKSYLRDGIYDSEKLDGDGKKGAQDRPIADLFPEATVMFADISGFTAWSSIREPSQVFILLETLYGAFDSIAMRRGVFKVETIGDSYVAVTGLPEPRPDHAVVMVRFAKDCRTRMSELTRKLGVSLGPDTEDLAMRFGLHSGPVTAGVLRGQKSRFQLFGDTVNTASRMESTGTRNRIQVSQSTADELIQHKQGHWLMSREDPVEAKGKGRMQTYWVEPKGRTGSVASVRTDAESSTFSSFSDKTERLVDWNTDILGRFVRCIIARRRRGNSKQNRCESAPGKEDGMMVLDEVKEIIELPEFDPTTMGSEADPDSIELEPAVISQLRECVVAMATSYKSNPFHNFEHASHVGMSVAKLLSRIVAADDCVYDKPSSLESSKHDHTFGITSDPLTQFACVFAALIHDVDHPGVPNTQLVKEDTPLARKYKNRSVAEQNSVDLAWNILMNSRYVDLREAICPTEGERQRLRQLVVNSVMATDIMDKELKQLRDARWEKAFSENAIQEEKSDRRASVNRKATIVIEHLIQASDVAHTMQHWHIYRKWNERLFEEMHQAYKAGRADTHPAEFWYKGELGFLDFYIVPLAKKLSECGIFGVSSDEYLDYALKNREEWERKGQEIVAEMMERLEPPI